MRSIYINTRNVEVKKKKKRKKKKGEKCEGEIWQRLFETNFSIIDHFEIL